MSTRLTRRLTLVSLFFTATLDASARSGLPRRGIAGGLELSQGSKDSNAAPVARTTRPARPAPKRATPRYPSVSLYGAHLGESLAYRPLDERGRPRRDAERSLERLLRCRQTGARHRLHPRLGAALYQIARHFSGRRVEIYSGYRPRAYCNRVHSRHMTGSAIDFHVEGVRNEELIAYLRKAFHPAGVGFYPHGVHVHLDVERSVDTYWVDPGPPMDDPGVFETRAADPRERDTMPLPTLPPEAELAEAIELPPPPLPAPPSSDPLLDDLREGE